MKRIYARSKFWLLLAVLLCAGTLSAQNMLSKQLIIANGGYFESANPTDWVSMQTYSPELKTTKVFDTIYTQSVQDVVINGSKAWVAAEDSIVLYDLNTYQRLAAVADSGLSQLYVYNDQLIVSKQYPLTHDFVQLRNANDLSLIYSVQEVSGEAAGIVVLDDMAYVAVNGGWMGTEGKIAVIDLVNQTYIEEIGLGADAVGIAELIAHEGVIFSVNHTPYGGTQGSISTFIPDMGSTLTTTIEGSVGKGIGLNADGAMLYIVLNNGVASFDTENQQIANASIVPDQGSASWISIASADYDLSMDQFYVNITDYASFGQGKVFSATGDSLSAYELGISPEAAAIQYVADFTFDDIDFFVGEGANTAMLVVDFRDGTEEHTYAWGYRFDGEPTAEQMINDIAAADEALSVNIDGGFLNDIIYDEHSGLAGDPDWWSTWSGSNIVNFQMNMGISEVLTDGAWFGCSYGFTPAPAMPTDPVAAPDLTGVEEEAMASAVYAYPNPAKDHLSIGGIGAEKCRVSLYDMAGRTVLILDDIIEGQSIPLTELQTGAYMMHVESEKAVYQQKIIIK